MENQVTGLRFHNDYEEMYHVMQYFKDGEWFDLGERKPLTKQDVIYLQSELPDLDSEIASLEDQLEDLKNKREDVVKELGLVGYYKIK